MTDQEIRQLIESGVERREIEYIMLHSEIGEDFQAQLIGLLAQGKQAQYEAAVFNLIRKDWKERERKRGLAQSF